MAPLYPSFTTTYHHDSYPTIDPTQPHLDCSDRIVLITGAGQGIGQAFAIAFAKAHAKGIAILGRNRSSLEETASAIESISPSTNVFITTADITQSTQVSTAISAIVSHYNDSVPDVLINNAGGALSFGRLEDQDLEDIWRTFELNVKGPLTVTQAFIRAHRSSSPSSEPQKKKVTVINVSSGGAHLPYLQGGGAYAVSKLANTKYTEVLHYEHPEWNVFNLQPGVVQTALAAQAGRKAPDTVELPGNFAVWLAADPRAEKLSGLFLWANWDIEEVLGKEKDIGERSLLTLGLRGWAEDVTVEELRRRSRTVHKDGEKKE